MTFVRKGLFLSLLGLWAGATICLAQLPQTAPEAMAITFQGTGPLATRPFITQKAWHVAYQAKSGIRIKVISTDGTLSDVLTDSSNENASAHSGNTDDINKTGGFTLEVKANGPWQITIVETGFTLNGEFSNPATSGSVAGQNPQNPGMPQPGAVRWRLISANNFSGGRDDDSTGSFTVKDNWVIFWTAQDRLKIGITVDGDTASEPTEITDYSNCDRPGPPLFGPDGAAMRPPMGYSPAINSNNGYSGSSTRTYCSYTRMGHGGTYTLHVHCTQGWQITIYQIAQAPDESASFGSNSDSNTNLAPTPAAPAPIVKLTEDQTRAVVLIKGDKAEGTGFLVKTADGPAVVTNIHVISGNPHVKITTNTGIDIPIVSIKGAADRDLAMLTIKDNNFKYLDLAPDVSATVQTGDDVVTPGNSQGGEVMLNTGGKVQGIGPQRVEFDNPIYHGNSGGPVFHTKSGKVVAVVTEAMKVDVSNELDKTSSQSRNSAISGSMRYFGLRLDTVTHWEIYDWRRFLNETLFLDEFHKESRCLDSFLNAPSRDSYGNPNPDANLYLNDEKIRAANDTYFQHVGTGVDSAQRLDAVRVLLFDLNSVSDNNMTGILNMSNFYTFDQERAKDEIAYRKALKAELDSIGNDVSRLGTLARRNN